MRKFPALAAFRKPSQKVLESTRLAMQTTLPDTSKAEASITLKRSAPCLGIDGTTYHVLDILIGLTQNQDWQGDNRPVVAISNARLADYTMRSERTVIRCLRKLVEAGILAYRDSATGRRFVSRAADGTQQAAFGLDFSPARARMQELKTMADAFKKKLDQERETRQNLAGLIRTLTSYVETLPIDLQEEMGKALAAIIAQEDIGDRQRLLALEALVDAHFPATEEQGSAPADIAFISEPMSPAGDTDVSSNNQTDIQHKNRSPFMPRNLGNPFSHKNEPVDRGASLKAKPANEPPLSFMLLAKGLRETQQLLNCTFRDWRALINAIPAMCRMISIKDDTLRKASAEVGPIMAATLLALVHEKACRGENAVRNPGGYFQSLVVRGKTGALRLQQSFYGLAQS